MSYHCRVPTWEKLLGNISIAMIIMFIVVIGWIVYCYVFPWQVMEFEESRLPIVGESFEPGDYIPIKLDFEKHTDLAGTMTIRIIDGRVVFLPDIQIYLKPGKYNYVDWYSAKLPMNMPPGRAKIIVGFISKPNMFRSIVEEIETEEFEVLPSASVKAYEQWLKEYNLWRDKFRKQLPKNPPPEKKAVPKKPADEDGIWWKKMIHGGKSRMDHT